MEKLELVFIPSPLMGHVGQLVELAKLMINRFNHLSITVLVMKLPTDPVGTTYTDSFSDNSAIRFIHFPHHDHESYTGNYNSLGEFVDLVIADHKNCVRDVVRQLTCGLGSESKSPPSRLGALVVDMFCTNMIDVGTEFGVPTYVFFTSNAAFLRIMLHFQTLHDQHGRDIAELKHSDTELDIPCYATPVPPGVLPFVLVDKRSWSNRFLRYAQKYREAKGIIVNTFIELESHALSSYDSQTPPVYTVGPMLKPEQTVSNNHIMQWLDGQPPSSVVFLCFGSRGYFSVDQVREIASGLERSGYRFLWSLRQPPSTGIKGFPEEYADPNEVLPNRFLERTAENGKVIGWAPQMAVLSHMAVGGFISHCGWNSIMESLWYGVPVATWPIYAEQQLNAFQLVRELGLGVEISLDYNQLYDNQTMVTAEEIEQGIRRLMDGGSDVRRRVKEMREKSRMALEEGGSSYTCLERLVNDFM